MVTKTAARMEGWLYAIRSHRFGLQFSQKRYFVLEDNCLICYKTKPTSQNEEPTRSAIVDSCIRVVDNGRASINRKVFFIFQLISTLNHNDQLKLGARSSEDAAKWIQYLQNAMLKECPNPAKDFVAVCKRQWPPLRLSISKMSDLKRYNSNLHSESMASDVIAPSPWKIFGCQNGLRLFKEAKDWDSCGKHWDSHPAIMAVGIVDGNPEAIFRTLMCLGPSRSEWDFCLYRGSVVDHLDGHTDIVHKQLYNDWLPKGLRRRDLLLRRYWRREDDSTYVILYHSVIHKKCPPQKGYVRACLKGGGYVVTPVNQGRQSVVKHMLSVDWKYWTSYLHPRSGRSITMRMLERVAALREMFKASAGNYTQFPSGELPIHMLMPQIEKEDIKTEMKGTESVKENTTSLEDENTARPVSMASSLTSLTDTSDEFFDVPDAYEMNDFDHLEKDWSSPGSGQQTPNATQPRLSSAAGIVKKLQELAVQKKGYVDLQESANEDSVMCNYGSTLQKDPSCALPCSWAAGDPSAFLIRGQNYLKDHQKIKANSTLMEMVGADWLRSDRREDDLGSRPDSIVQRFAAEGRPEFFFIVNIQVPGSTMHTLALYYMLKTPLEETSALHKFVIGDDAYRNARFKLIPYISQGSWIVKQSVGKKACLIGQALEVNYFPGKNYLEAQIDVGSSTVARGVANLVLGYLTKLVMEMAFVIQANTEEELPELLLGTCRLNRLDATKTVLV